MDHTIQYHKLYEIMKCNMNYEQIILRFDYKITRFLECCTIFMRFLTSRYQDM